MKISAVIITYNEEKNIERCLKSLVGVVDEILVVDSFSSDRTEEICLAAGARFVQNKFEGHIQQKNFAMNLASNDWVLSLDADEELTSELRKSIQSINLDSEDVAYAVKRLTSFCGQWIRHCGWYPDKKIRLWNRKQGQWGGQNPHDKVILDKGIRVITLNGDLLHYSFYTIEQHVQTIQKFSSIAAQSAYDNGKRSNLLINILIGPAFAFFKRYILLLGFLDGYFGLIISVNSAYSRYLKYIKLREIERNNGN